MVAVQGSGDGGLRPRADMSPGSGRSGSIGGSNELNKTARTRVDVIPQAESKGSCNRGLERPVRPELCIL